jgi:hypothetical protein
MTKKKVFVNKILIKSTSYAIYDINKLGRGGFGRGPNDGGPKVTI